MKTIEEIRAEIRKLPSGEHSISILSSYISTHPDSDEAYTLRGMQYWGCGKRSEAIKDYLTAIRINPHSRAAMALKVANEILDYRNKDLYNP